MSEKLGPVPNEQVRINRLNELQYLTHEKITQRLGSKHLADLITERPKWATRLEPIKFLMRTPKDESDGYSQSGSSYTVNGITKDWLTNVAHGLDGKGWSIKTFWESKSIFPDSHPQRENLWAYYESSGEIRIEGDLSIENVLKIILERIQNSKISPEDAAIPIGGLGLLSKKAKECGEKEPLIPIFFYSTPEKSYGTFHLAV